jgi:hypothetical protein
MKVENQMKYYNMISDILTMVTVLVMSSFFILKWIVYRYIPAYKDGIRILAILYGIVIFRSLLLLVCNNYFKILKITKVYSFINIVALIISFLLNIVGYVCFSDYAAIAVASLVSFILWYALTEIYLMKKLDCSWKTGIRRYILIIISLVVFMILGRFDIKTAFLIYIVAAVISIIMIFGVKNVKAKGFVNEYKSR